MHDYEWLSYTLEVEDLSIEEVIKKKVKQFVSIYLSTGEFATVTVINLYGIT